MKRLFIGALCGACLLGLFLPDRCAAQKFRNDYYDTRRAAHDEEALPSGAVVFLGNSITEQGWWNVLFRDPKVVNRGIGGDNTFGMLDRLPGILAAQPSKIFLMAGINDITGGQSTETIAANALTSTFISKSFEGLELVEGETYEVEYELAVYPANMSSIGTNNTYSFSDKSIDLMTISKTVTLSI